MPTDECTELRDALIAFQDACKAGDTHRAESALEAALLTTSAAGIDAGDETVAAAVRLLRAADDNGTTRLEVRDQGMTHRRWFEVSTNGDTTWGDR
jgi:K+-transporting ATPase c subunit